MEVEDDNKRSMVTDPNKQTTLRVYPKQSRWISWRLQLMDDEALIKQHHASNILEYRPLTVQMIALKNAGKASKQYVDERS